MIEENFTNVNEKIDIKDKTRNFRVHKSQAEKIQQIISGFYDTSNKLYSRGEQVLNCGHYLSFRTYENDERTTKLDYANFCKHRLCPFCAWRWHLKYSNILEKTFEILGEHDYYHLVLTIPNVKHITKDFIVDLRQKATKFLKKYLKISDYFLSFEITIDNEGSFHPHYHVAFIKKADLPTKREMQKKWAEFSNCGTNYAICHVEKTKDKKVSLELTKYLLKFENEKLNERNLFTIFRATRGIRKFSTSGIIKEAETKAKKQIDLENFNTMQTLQNYPSIVEFYEWFGSCYELVETHKDEKKNIKSQIRNLKKIIVAE